MPVNRRWPIRELMDAATEYQEVTGRRVTFEYTLMEGVNDSDEIADELAQLLAGRHTHVNLIPMNPSEDQDLHAPTLDRARGFLDRLDRRGIAATVRVNRGRDILAACGQLRLKERRKSQRRGAAMARGGRPVEDLLVDFRSARGGERRLSVNGSLLPEAPDEEGRILLSIADVTDRSR